MPMEGMGMGLIPGSENPLEEEHCNPLWYSCLKSMDTRSLGPQFTRSQKSDTTEVTACTCRKQKQIFENILFVISKQLKRRDDKELSKEIKEYKSINIVESASFIGKYE